MAMPWPEADVWLADWEQYRDLALGGDAKVMDMKTGLQLRPAPD